MAKLYRMAIVGDEDTEVYTEPVAYLVAVSRIAVEKLKGAKFPEEVIDQHLAVLRDDLLYRWARDGHRLEPIPVQ